MDLGVILTAIWIVLMLLLYAQLRGLPQSPPYGPLWTYNLFSAVGAAGLTFPQWIQVVDVLLVVWLWLRLRRPGTGRARILGLVVAIVVVILFHFTWLEVTPPLSPGSLVRVP